MGISSLVTGANRLSNATLKNIQETTTFSESFLNTMLRRSRRQVSIYSHRPPQAEGSYKKHIHISEILKHEDKYFPEFGLLLRKIGNYNPTIKNYLLTLKYDFHTLRNQTWFRGTIPDLIEDAPVLEHANQFHRESFRRLLASIRKIQLNREHRTDTTSLGHGFNSPTATCHWVNGLYYNNTLNIGKCAREFQSHCDNGQVSYYTVHLVLDFLPQVAQAQARHGSMSSWRPDRIFNLDKTWRSFSVASFKPVLYHYLLNITLHYMQVRFIIGLHSATQDFDTKIESLFKDINAYIPRFVTSTGVSGRRSKRIAITTLLGAASGLFTAWRIYKDYQFKQNLRRTLRHLVSNDHKFRDGIINNHRNLVSLAEITHSSFRKAFGKIDSLKRYMDMRFHKQSVINLKFANDIDFLRRYQTYYLSTVMKFSHDMAVYRSKHESARVLLHAKAKEFIQGLHTLALNRLPETIVSPSQLKNILTHIEFALKSDQMYDLLYGTDVSIYYHIDIVRSFILNNVLYITVIIPLIRLSTPVMTLYRVETFYMPTNMAISKAKFGSYSKLHIPHSYLLLNNFQYAYLASDFSRNTMQFDNLYVPKHPILLFELSYRTCIIDILEHAKVDVLIQTCNFKFYQNITVTPSLVTTASHYFLLNVATDLTINCPTSLYTPEGVHSVSIITRQSLCRCTLQSKTIFVTGTDTNCSTSRQFHIQYTFNFATEYLVHQTDIKGYNKYTPYLSQPSESNFIFPQIDQEQTNNVLQVATMAPIDLTKLEAIIHDTNLSRIFRSKADKNYQEIAFLKDSEKRVDMDTVDDWFGDEYNPTMVFIFIASVIAIFCLFAVLFLFCGQGKLHNMLLYKLGAIQQGVAVEAFFGTSASDAGPTLAHLYIHIAIAIVTVLIACLLYKLACLLIYRFNVFRTIMVYRSKSNSKGTRYSEICLEVCNYVEDTHVTIMVIHSPSALITMDSHFNTPPSPTTLDTGYFSTVLKLKHPIYIRHEDCACVLISPVTFSLGIIQAHTLKRIFKRFYFIRVVAIQDNLKVYLSTIYPSNTIESFHNNLTYHHREQDTLKLNTNMMECILKLAKSINPTPVIIHDQNPAGLPLNTNPLPLDVNPLPLDINPLPLAVNSAIIDHKISPQVVSPIVVPPVAVALPPITVTHPVLPVMTMPPDRNVSAPNGGGICPVFQDATPSAPIGGGLRPQGVPSYGCLPTLGVTDRQLIYPQVTTYR